MQELVTQLRKESQRPRFDPEYPYSERLNRGPLRGLEAQELVGGEVVLVDDYLYCDPADLQRYLEATAPEDLSYGALPGDVGLASQKLLKAVYDRLGPEGERLILDGRIRCALGDDAWFVYRSNDGEDYGLFPRSSIQRLKTRDEKTTP